MKIFKKLLYISIVSLLVVSCDTNDEVTGYDSSRYDYETSPTTDFTIAVDDVSVTETAFDFLINADEAGQVYYMVTAASAAAPTNVQIHAASNNVSVMPGTAARINIDGGSLLASADYKVYAVFKNVDNFISESVATFSQSLTGCPPTGGVYNAQPNAFGSDLTPFTVTLTPTANANEYTLLTTWGPNLVFDLTGDRQYIGQFLYPSTLKINDDASVTVTGDGGFYTGGSGTYTVCDDIIQVTLTQGIFTNPFTVDVTFTR